MVMQEEKTKGDIRICVDLCKLNDASLHDPFLTPFTDEVLDNVGGQDRRSTPSLMAFQATIRLEYIQKIDPRPPLQQNGACSSIR